MRMSLISIPNNHVLRFATNNDLDEETVYREIERWLQEAEQHCQHNKLYPEGKPPFRLNYIRKGEKYLGFCFIWIEFSEFFNIMRGLNPDGSERIETTFSDKESESWADEDPTIVKLEPLISPLFGIVDQALMSSEFLEDNKSRTTLQSHNLDESVTINQLKAVFDPFSSKPGFPYITLSKYARKRGQIAMITYSHQTYDAIWSFAMNRRFELCVKGEIVSYFCRQIEVMDSQ